MYNQYEFFYKYPGIAGTVYLFHAWQSDCFEPQSDCYRLLI